MVFPKGSPVEGWEKLYEAQAQAVEHLYNQKRLQCNKAVISRPSCDSSASSIISESAKDSQRPSKMASLKSFLRGDIQRHHGMYVLEEAVTGVPNVARASYNATTRSSSVASGSTTSSLKKFFVSGEEKPKPKPNPKPRRTHMSAQMRHIGAVPC